MHGYCCYPKSLAPIRRPCHLPLTLSDFCAIPTPPPQRSHRVSSRQVDIPPVLFGLSGGEQGRCGCGYGNRRYTLTRTACTSQG